MNESIQRYLERRSSIKAVPFESKFIDQAAVIAKEMHDGSIYRDMPLDLNKVMTQLAACGNIVPDRYFRFAVRGEEVLGGFYGSVMKTFFCDDFLAQDMGWWVKSTSRGSAAAIVLLSDFEMWAKSKGAKKVMVGQSTAVNIESTTKLFKHCGFRVIGYNTVKDL